MVGRSFPFLFLSVGSLRIQTATDSVAAFIFLDPTVFDLARVTWAFHVSEQTCHTKKVWREWFILFVIVGGTSS